MTYLVSEYSSDDSLYPKDTRIRALVDQRLQFDLGTLYARFGDYFVSFKSIHNENNDLIIKFKRSSIQRY